MTLAIVLLLTASPAAWGLPVQVEEQAVAEDTKESAAEVVEPVAESLEEEPESDPELENEGAEEDDGIVISIDDDTGSRDSDRRRHRRSVDKDTQIHVGSNLVVREDEVARNAVVVSGSLDIQGKVIGDAVCILGSVTIDGEVTGEVVAVGGSVYMGPDAEVMGDVISIGGSVDREPGSRVLGEISEVDIGPAIAWPDLPQFWRFDGPRIWDFWQLGTAWSVFWTLFKWVLLVLLTSLVFLVAREPVERTSRQIRGEFWKSSLLGLVAIVFFPFLFAMVCIVLAITIIGIPLLIVIIPLSVMLLIFALLLGYTASAYTAGRWLGHRFGWSLPSPYLALLVGVVAIQVLSLFARLLGSLGGYVLFFAVMFGLAGWFVRFAAWTTGFGAALLTQLGRREPSIAPPPSAVGGAPTAPKPDGQSGTAAQLEDASPPGPDPAAGESSSTDSG